MCYFYLVGLMNKYLGYFLSGSTRLGLVIFARVEKVNILGFLYHATAR